MPCKKIGYKTQKLATQALKKLRDKKGRSLLSYYCFDCLHWHLTSMSPAVFVKTKKFIGMINRKFKPKS